MCVVAQKGNITRKTLFAIINGCPGVSPEMALRLSKALNTSPEIWINLQARFALWNAKQKLLRMLRP